nr:retrovirus-related Pol polyprotein from transposon TNT 1-94 [Tanacetum cinerariifolium]
FINQAKYAQEILIKHGMTSCDSIGTPMATKHLDADLSGTSVDQTKYRSMFGALMYLTASIPDIVHATCYCARYQAKLTEKHLTVVKWIFRYLKDTINMRLWYPKDTGFKLTAFSNSDHAGCLDSRKSTSGGIQFLGGGKLVNWSSKKQDCTSMSSAEAEKPTFNYFRVFGSKCFILNTKDYLTKFDPNSYKGVFLGYSQNSKAYIILNKHTKKVKESLNVTFNETPTPSKTSPLADDDLDEEEAIMVTEKKNLENDIKDETFKIDEIVNIKESHNHPSENVIGNLNQRTLRSQAQNQSNFFCFISTIDPKNLNETLTDDSWIVAMQEELNQFIANDVWELVPQPRNMKIIGTKWMCRKKLDKNGIVSRNKARLVAQGYNQQESIDYNETYAPVARIESIRILLAYALDFKLFRIDVKSAFLKGFINEEVYVAQPPGFIDFEKPNHVYKLKKALYGLKQAPKAWSDIMFSVCLCARFQEAPKTSHLEKQTALAISTIEAEYVSAGKKCQQALLMKQDFIDYDVRLDDVPIM